MAATVLFSQEALDQHSLSFWPSHWHSCDMFQFEEEGLKQEPVCFSLHLDDLPERDSRGQPVLKGFITVRTFNGFSRPMMILQVPLQAAHIIKVPFTVLTSCC